MDYIGSWEIWWYLDKSTGDSLEDFMKGLIIECFICWGIFPVSREVSSISLKSGVSVVDSFL